MTLIRIIRGGCGISWTDANGILRHALKTPENGPFECSEAQASRLVSLGVATYESTTEDTPNKTGGTERTPDLEGQETDAASNLSALTYNELKKRAARLGVKPKSQKQADLIAAIEEAEAGTDKDSPEIRTTEEDTEDDPDTAPELSAANPV